MDCSTITDSASPLVSTPLLSASRRRLANPSARSGSMDTDCLASRSTVTLQGVSRPCKIVPLSGSTPHAFLMDCTHDNQSPLDKRSAEDALATGALVTFAHAAVGSNRGFDDLYPKLLDVVSETRRYEVAGVEAGIGGVKRLLNHLHTELVLDDGIEGHFSEEGEVGSLNSVI